MTADGGWGVVEEWSRSLPVEMTGDPLWRVSAYRQSLYLSDLAWADVTLLSRDRRTYSLSDQLYRAVGSVGANIAEGYSRGTGRDRARFYEYALGPARESRDWYFKARHVLGVEVTDERIKLLSSIIRLFLRMVPDQRTPLVREADVRYDADPNCVADHAEE